MKKLGPDNNPRAAKLAKMKTPQHIYAYYIYVYIYIFFFFFWGGGVNTQNSSGMFLSVLFLGQLEILIFLLRLRDTIMPRKMAYSQSRCRPGKFRILYIYMYICLRVLNWTPFGSSRVNNWTPFLAPLGNTTKTGVSRPHFSTKKHRYLKMSRLRFFWFSIKWGFSLRSFGIDLKTLFFLRFGSYRSKKGDTSKNAGTTRVSFLEGFGASVILPFLGLLGFLIDFLLVLSYVLRVASSSSSSSSSSSFLFLLPTFAFVVFFSLFFLFPSPFSFSFFLLLLHLLLIQIFIFISFFFSPSSYYSSS